MCPVSNSTLFAIVLSSNPVMIPLTIIIMVTPTTMAEAVMSVLLLFLWTFLQASFREVAIIILTSVLPFVTCVLNTTEVNECFAIHVG